MARLPRLDVPGYAQHIVQRGNNKQATFVTIDDYAVYLDKLKLYSKEFNVDVHAFCLMTNHVHLLLTPHLKQGISKLMQSLGRYYVRYFNQTYKRTGTLWEGRYKSTLVDSEHYFLAVCRYIELNPVKANMVELPHQYPWSSFHHNAGSRKANLITEHSCYLALGNTEKARAMKYRTLFDNQLSDAESLEIKSATDNAWVLGSKKFKDEMEQLTKRRSSPLPRGGDRKSENWEQKQQ